MGLEQRHRRDLENLDRHSERSRPRQLYDRAREHFRALGYEALGGDALEKFLSSPEAMRQGTAARGTILFLRPTEKGDLLLPAVTLKCGFEQTSSELRIRAGLCLFDTRDVFRVLGCRWEMPEGDGSGRHDFCHLQFIEAFENGASKLNHPSLAMDWLPQGQPSIPLDAVCPLTLTLAFLVSVYGLWYLDEIQFNGLLTEDQAKTTHCWKGRPRFWNVKDRRGRSWYLSDPAHRDRQVVQAAVATKQRVPSSELRMTSIRASEYASSPPACRIKA